MKYRCTKPKNTSFRFYGAKGIRVCDEWLKSYESFYRDMGSRPSPAHELDRIDHHGHYEPANCRWVTIDVQANNRSNNRTLTHNGITMNMSQWARHLGMHPMTLQARLGKLGWTIDEALTSLVRPLKAKTARIRQ